MGCMGYLIRPQPVVIKQRIKQKREWEKAVNKVVIECWIRSEPTKRKYRQRMKKIWDEIGVFSVAEQRLADQARQIRTNKWLTDIEMEEIRRQLERNNSKAEIQENDQEIIEHMRISRVNRKSKEHRRSWLKDMRMSSSRKHITLVHFQEIMNYQ